MHDVVSVVNHSAALHYITGGSVFGQKLSQDHSGSYAYCVKIRPFFGFILLTEEKILALSTGCIKKT